MLIISWRRQKRVGCPTNASILKNARIYHFHHTIPIQQPNKTITNPNETAQLYFHFPLNSSIMINEQLQQNKQSIPLFDFDFFFFKSYQFTFQMSNPCFRPHRLILQNLWYFCFLNIKWYWVSKICIYYHMNF